MYKQAILNDLVKLAANEEITEDDIAKYLNAPLQHEKAVAKLAPWIGALEGGAAGSAIGGNINKGDKPINVKNWLRGGGIGLVAGGGLGLLANRMLKKKKNKDSKIVEKILLDRLNK